MVVALSVGAGTSAPADVIYSYTGNNYSNIDDWTPPSGSYNTSMSVSGWFTLAAALAPNLTNAQFAPLTFSFFDGRSTLHQNSSLSNETFQVSTNSSGEIVSWSITLTTNLNNNLIRGIESFNAVAFGVFDLGYIAPVSGNADSGENMNNAGSWAISAIPEPASGLFLAIGLLCLMPRHRHRESRPQFANGQ